MSATTAPTLTEAQMLAGLKSAAKQLGYLVYHNLYAPGSDLGYPDLTIVGHGHVFVFELKGPRGRVRPEQREWIVAFQSVGVFAQFVWPSDYQNVLDMLLEGIAR